MNIYRILVALALAGTLTACSSPPATSAPAANGAPTVQATAAAKPGPDSGLAVCRDAAANMPGTKDLTKAGYQEWRAKFTGSSYPDIRKAGEAFAAAMWKLATVAKGGKQVPFDTLDAFATNYGKFSDACAAHGIKIPPLGISPK